VAVLECLGAVWACGVFGNGTKALSTSDDTVLRVWDLGTGACDHAVPGHPHRDYCLEVYDGGTAAGCPSGGTGVGGGVARCVTGGDAGGGSLRLWHLPVGPAKAFALSPAVVPSLLQAMSPKPKAKKKKRPSVAPQSPAAPAACLEEDAPVLLSPRSQVDADMYQRMLVAQASAAANLDQFGLGGSSEEEEAVEEAEEGAVEDEWGEADVKLNMASLF
jgi:hypothetical protein